MSFSNDSKQKLTAIAFVIILLLLATNAVLLYNNYQKGEENAELQTDLDDTSKLKKELEKLHYSAQEEIELMKGDNADLNELIDQQKGELSKSKKRISALLSGGKKTKRELEEIKTMMDEMRMQSDGYLAQIKNLKDENVQLTEVNTQLNSEKDELSLKIVEEQKMNDELTTARAALVTETENLTSRNANLNATVVRASVIDVRDLSVSGWKVKKSGKAIKKKYAKNIDRLKVCFTAEPNDVAETGEEDFYVRLITPQGETIAVESMGSGTFVSTDEDATIRYTHVKSVDYKKNEDTVGCFLWEPGTPFTKGTYSVEVFNKGYLTGKNTFKLK